MRAVMPNTALEPTASIAFILHLQRFVSRRFSRRGSALDR
jgi:hypothetical protein